MARLQEYRYSFSSGEGERIVRVGGEFESEIVEENMYPSVNGYNIPLHKWRLSSCNYVDYVFNITLYAEENVESFLEEIRAHCKKLVRKDIDTLESMLKCLGTASL